MTVYSHWTPCSVTCGKGLRERRRKYLDPLAAERASCNQQLIETEMCPAPEPYCTAETASDEVRNNDRPFEKVDSISLLK